jgi:HCO3- transporter family
MDQNITVRLMMSKENKLKKGSGLHLDMFVVSLVTAITSVLGMPWMVAATVRSLAHMRSLRQYEISDTTDGEIKVEMTGVQEQRITGLAIHSLIGLSVIAFRDALRGIPNAVLTGLFLFLGTSSIVTTELWNRFLLFFTYPQDTPKEAAHWMREVGALRTKAFTAIQLVLLGAMLWIKGTRLGVYFPVLIGALAPIRIALEKWNVFSQKELEALDGEIA